MKTVLSMLACAARMFLRPLGGTLHGPNAQESVPPTSSGRESGESSPS
jgi:hypothetical protein